MIQISSTKIIKKYISRTDLGLFELTRIFRFRRLWSKNRHYTSRRIVHPFRLLRPVSALQSRSKFQVCKEKQSDFGVISRWRRVKTLSTWYQASPEGKWKIGHFIFPAFVFLWKDGLETLKRPPFLPDLPLGQTLISKQPSFLLSEGSERAKFNLFMAFVKGANWPLF